MNTPIIAMFIHAGDVDFTSNLSVPVIYRLPYLNVRPLTEPQHDKTNKMSVRPAKTQISLGIRPV